MLEERRRRAGEEEEEAAGEGGGEGVEATKVPEPAVTKQSWYGKLLSPQPKVKASPHRGRREGEEGEEAKIERGDAASRG